MARISSGVGSLDNLLAGGFPPGSAVLVIGSPGSGKSTLAMRIVCSNLKEGRRCVYLTTCERPEVLKNKLKVFAPDLADKERNVAFIDCSSSLVSQGIQAYRAISGAGARVDELAKFFERVLSQIGFKDGIVIIDSFSDFLSYCDDETAAFSFMQLVSSEARKLDSVGLIMMEEGVNTLQQVSTATAMSDDVVELNIRENKRMMRVAKLAEGEPSSWVELEPQKGETIISVREFFK